MRSKVIRLATATCTLALLTLPTLAQSTAPSKPPDDKHTVYVPYERLDTALQGIPKGVILPYDEFQRLWQARYPLAPLDANTSPVPWVVSGAEYSADVRGEWASIRAEIHVESLRDAWQLVPIGLAGLAATTTEASGDARLVASDSGYSVLVPRRGTYRVAVDLAVPISADRGARAFTFATAKSAFSRLRVTVPEPGVVFEPSGALVSSVKEDATTTTLLAFLGAAETATVRYTLRPRETDGTPEVASELRARIHLDETTARIGLAASYRITGGAIERVAVTLPAGFTALSVDGADVRSWRASEGRLAIELRGRVRGTTALTIDLEAPRDPAQATFAFVVPSTDGAVREAGHVVVSASPSLRVRVEPSVELRRVDPTELGKDATGRTGQEAYRFLRPPGEVRISIQPVTPRLVVAADHRYHVSDTRLVLESTLAITVEEQGTFRLRVVPPAGLERDPLVGADQIESVRATKDGDRDVLEVFLRKRAEGTIRMPLRFTGPFDLTAATHALPRLEMLDVEREEGRVGISLDPALRGTVVSSAGVDAIPASSLPAELYAAAPAPVALAFRYRRPPFAIDLRVERREIRVTAVVDTSVQVEENREQVASLLRYRIEFAGRSTFRFDVPTAVVDRIKVDVPNLKEQVKEGEDANAPGETIVRLTLQSEARDALVVRVSWETPFDPLASGASGERRAAPIRALDVDRQSGSLAIAKAANLEVTAEAEGGELMDVSELPAETRGSAFLAFRFLDLNPRPRPAGAPGVKLHITRHEYEPLLELWVQHLDLVTVVGAEGVSRTAAALAMKNGGKQYLEMKLPKGSSILTLAVAGEPERPARRAVKSDDDTILVPLPRTTDPDRLFPVQLVYETKHEGTAIEAGALGGSLEFFAPNLVGVPVSTLSWTVYLPRTSRYLEFGGNLELHPPSRWFEFPEFPRALTGFLDRGAPPVAAATPAADASAAAKGGAYAISIALEREGLEYRFSRLGGDARLVVHHVRLWAFRVLEVIAFFLMFAVGVAFGRRRPSQKATFLVVALAALLVLTTFVDEGLAALVEAAFYGLLALAALWATLALAHAISRWRARGHRGGALATDVAGGAKP